MRIEVALQEGLNKALRRRGEKVRTGSNEALVEQTTALKNDMRQRASAAFPASSRVAGAIRSGVRKDPHKIAGFVYSAWKRPAAAGGREPKDILAAYSEGATVKPYRGRWLAIPTKEARVKGTVRNIDYWAASKGIQLAFVPPQPGKTYALLVEAARTGTVRRKGVSRVRTRTYRGQERRVMFILIKVNRIPKRIDFATPVQKARTGLADAVARNIGIERD